jgi:hypothetical protein
MSMPRQVSVTCEQCAKQHPFTAWDSLNVTLDRDAKDQLLKGELTRFKCPACGRSGNVLYPMLYHDMEKHLMIWLWPAAGDPDMSSVPAMGSMNDYQFRIVSTRNHLVEKILLFDSGLDDRMVEFFKLLIQARASQDSHPLPGEILFSALQPGPDGVESLAFEHLSEAGSEAFAVPRQTYQQLAESFAAKLPSLQSQAGKWLRVDRAFAESLTRQLL